MAEGEETCSDLDLGQTVRGLRSGQRMFGRYQLERMLGRGGMGVVWLAHDEQLERNVALKFLPELIVHDGAVLDDLKRETVRSLQLTHHHIVRIYDFAQDAGSACISMEYVDGRTLSELRITRPLKVLEVSDLEPLLSQACEALEYAHSVARVVHRDLKPTNLMLSAKGELKIADFGIARSLSDSVSLLTMGRQSSGTLPYMSPQQLDGEALSALDDIYSLGATIYELLTGKPPFYRGDVSGQVRMKLPPSMAVRREELEVRGAGPIPPRWEKMVAACLAKVPADRPKSAMQVMELLREDGPQNQLPRAALSVPRVPMPVSAPALHLGWPIAAALAILLAAIGIGLGLSRKPETVPIVIDTQSQRGTSSTSNSSQAATAPERVETPVPASTPGPSASSLSGEKAFQEGLEFLGGLNRRPIDREAAFARFLQAAAAGLPEAMAPLARAADTGMGSEKNPVQAIEWASRALEHGLAARAERNIAGAELALGMLYEDGLGVGRDFAQALTLYTHAAKQGDTFAQVYLGRMYANGKGVPENPEEAATFYEQAAKAGNAIGQSYLGVALAKGWGLMKDEAQAVYWYRKAAEQGDPEGQMQLGIMCENGRGCEKNDREAAFWFRKAADQGNLYGETYLGMMFEKGRGVSQDYGQARAWYEKAAEHGSAEGQMYLAGLYERGRGVTQDDRRAVALYRQAAEQGNGYGQTYLGSMYERGRGVPQDYGEAVAWYRKAAEQGNSYGQTYLGAMYEKGRGVPKDRALAISFYEKAAAHGNGEGKEALVRLTGKNR